MASWREPVSFAPGDYIVMPASKDEVYPVRDFEEKFELLVHICGDKISGLPDDESEDTDALIPHSTRTPAEREQILNAVAQKKLLQTWQPMLLAEGVQIKQTAESLARQITKDDLDANGRFVAIPGIQLILV